jgi:glycosyltransferase involved in cell wall biosynthesis
METAPNQSVMPTVTVIVPVHNAVQFLSSLHSQLTAIAPAAAQIVVVDDNSEDDTLDEVSLWRLPTELIVTRSPGRGVAAARNHALGLVTSECVWMVDSDDSWPADAITRLAAAMTRETDVVLCDARREYPDGSAGRPISDGSATPVPVTGSEALRRLLLGEIEGHLWNKLFRTSLIRDTGFPPTNAHSDLGGVIRFFANARSVVGVGEQLYTYGMRSGSILHRRTYDWRDLPTCLEIAQAAVDASGDVSLKSAMSVFAARSIIIPLQIESIRREAVVSATMIRDVRHMNRRRIVLRDAFRILASKRWRLGAQVIAIWVAPAAYRFAYLRKGKRISVTG